MFAVSAAGNLRLRRISKPVAQLIAVVLASVVGTVLVVLVKGRNLVETLTEWEGITRFSITATFGVAFGGLITAYLIFRERDAEARAAVHKAGAETSGIARRMAEAQLALMQAQIEPHFLFNTHANVRYLVEHEPANALRMLDHLIEYLKAALPQMRDSVGRIQVKIKGASDSLEVSRSYAHLFRQM